MRRVHFLLLLIITFFPMACSSWEPSRPDPQDLDLQGSRELAADTRSLSPTDIIAIDFVNALKQIRTLPPSTTIIQLLANFRNDAFTLSMQSALQAAGYEVLWTDGSFGEPLFHYRHERVAQNDQGYQELFEVAVGVVEFRRSYQTVGQGNVSPISPLYIRGTDASHVVLLEEHFRHANDGHDAIIQPVVSKQALQREPLAASVSRPTVIPVEASPLNPLISGADRQADLSLPLLALPRDENVFELGGSNFEDVLASHHVVRRQVLTFPNDSLRLGGVNKSMLEQLIKQFQPDSDVFQLLGCSMGATSVQGGNAALALGRASRVREALLFAGVPRDKILDEGCWAGDSAIDSLPRRGVVVTLNRQT